MVTPYHVFKNSNDYFGLIPAQFLRASHNILIIMDKMPCSLNWFQPALYNELMMFFQGLIKT